jgi:GNAT superfamily N-acetyltransferase
MVGIEIRNELEARRAGQLCDLFAQTWWAADRDEPYVRRVLAGSDLVFGLVDLSSDRLVGFARALTDDVYIALLLDVVVAQDRRKAGLGRLLMDTVVAHPRLARVESLELVCRPELVPFYRRWGFSDRVGASNLLRRTSNRALVADDAAGG